MAIHYVSNDPVNRQVARRLAEQRFVNLRDLQGGDPLPVRGVLVCDWDSLSDQQRQAILSLASGNMTVVVHSYYVGEPDQTAKLAASGIIILPRLNLHLIDSAAGRREAA